MAGGWRWRIQGPDLNVAVAVAIVSCARLRTFLEGSEEIFIDLRDA